MVLDILEYGFIQRALISGVAISGICSFVGAFLVMRRLAMFGDGIAHVAFGGIAVGLLASVYPIWTALVVSVAGSMGLQKLRSSTKISGEIAVAVTLVAGLTVGIILTSISGGFTLDLFSFLFGSIVLVGTEDMAVILGISAVVVALLCVLYRPLLFITFNEEMAHASGIRTTALNYLFVAVAAVVVVTAMRLTGILLVTALIVLPTIAAVRFNRGFKATILVSVAISASSIVSGIFLSYVLDWAPSGTIVMLLLIFLGAIYLTFAIRDRRSASTTIEAIKYDPKSRRARTLFARQALKNHFAVVLMSAGLMNNVLKKVMTYKAIPARTLGMYKDMLLAVSRASMVLDESEDLLDAALVQEIRNLFSMIKATDLASGVGVGYPHYGDIKKQVAHCTDMLDRMGKDVVFK